MEEFKEDLNDKDLTTENIANKYFKLSQETVLTKSDQITRDSLLIELLSNLRNRMNNCEGEINYKDYNTSLNEKVEGSFIIQSVTFDNIFFMLCDNKVITPIKIEKDRIKAFSAYKKGGEIRYLLEWW